MRRELSCFYSSRHQSPGRIGEDDHQEEPTLKRFFRVAARIWPYIILIYVNFFVTLFIYPQMALRPNPPVDYAIYQTISVFFTFNFSALCGNILALKFPSSKKLNLYIILLSRVCICIPFFVLYQIDSVYDYFKLFTIAFVVSFSLVISFAGFTSGYLASCSFYAILKYDFNLQDKVLALRMMNCSLSVGLASGAIAAYLFFFVFK